MNKITNMTTVKIQDVLKNKHRIVHCSSLTLNAQGQCKNPDKITEFDLFSSTLAAHRPPLTAQRFPMCTWPNAFSFYLIELDHKVPQ